MVTTNWYWPFWLQEALGLESYYVAVNLLRMALGFAVSLGFSLLMVWTQRWHAGLTADYTSGIQKVHTGSTPRVGGGAVFLGLLAATPFTNSPVQPILSGLIIAGGPAFFFGLIEDLTGKVCVKLRYLATLVSAVLFIWLMDKSLNFEIVPGLHWIMHFSVISILFTILAVGGLAQSINIIDGLNGISSLVSVFAFSGFAWIAYQEGDYPLLASNLILAAAVLGFFCVNWPLGKLFLGDGGAYFIGFCLAAMGVLLVERNLPVSDFAVFLICVHPIIEVLFSMYRRRQRGMGITQADRLHFHTLLKIRYIQHWFPRMKLLYRNSIAGLMMSSFTLLAVILAVWSYKNVLLSALLCVAMVALYIGLYVRMVRFRLTKTIKLKATLHQLKNRRHAKNRRRLKVHRP